MISRAVALMLLTVVLAGNPGCTHHLLPRPLLLNSANHKLAGQVVDHTNNHGRDRRIFSPALDEKRDLYVYLPPGYRPVQAYPLAIFLHGFRGDEMQLPRRRGRAARRGHRLRQAAADDHRRPRRQPQRPVTASTTPARSSSTATSAASRTTSSTTSTIS